MRGSPCSRIAFQDSEAIKSAEDVLLDKHPEVRTAAASALGEMRSTASIPQSKLFRIPRSQSPSCCASLVILKDQAGYEVMTSCVDREMQGE